MEDARIEFARAAWNKFQSFSPSQEDRQSVKDELLRLRNDPDVGIPVPFGQWQGCCLTWSGKWRIIYKRENPGAIYVVHIDDEMR
jgi:hypothetical protein